MKIHDYRIATNGYRFRVERLEEYRLLWWREKVWKPLLTIDLEGFPILLLFMTQKEAEAHVAKEKEREAIRAAEWRVVEQEKKA